MRSFLSSFNRGVQVKLPIFRMKVCENGENTVGITFCLHFPPYKDRSAYFWTGPHFVGKLSPYGDRAGVRGARSPGEVHFGKARIEGETTFCPEKFAYRFRGRELGPRQPSRTRLTFVKFFTNLAGQTEHLFPPYRKRGRGH